MSFPRALPRALGILLEGSRHHARCTDQSLVVQEVVFEFKQFPVEGASSFHENGQYKLLDKSYTTAELLTKYQEIHTALSMLQMVEDPYDEHDFANFAKYHEVHPGVLTIGDDLTTTNQARLTKAIKENAINALIIKPN